MNIKAQAVQLISRVTKLQDKQIESVLETPPNPKLGDLAFPCFILSKKLKKSPGEIAVYLRDKLIIPKDSIFKRIEVGGPYLNFFVNEGKFAEQILEKVLKNKNKYGSSKQKNKIYVMDVFQPNTHKAFHIGHIRNAAIGESIRRILNSYGIKTKAIAYIGDVGAHVAKWIWYYTNFYKGKIPKKDVSDWAGELYAKASKLAKANEKNEFEVQETLIKLEEGDKELNDLWKKTRKLCLEDFWKIQKELGVHLDGKIYESEVEKPGKKIVKHLIDKGIAEISDDAPILDLEKYGLKTLLLQKSTGASLYSTKDLGLAELKREKYKFNKSLYVVGSEQIFYFQQMFKAFEILWPKTIGSYVHIAYGLVQLPSGKMGSRFGTAILYKDLRDKMIEGALKEVKKRNKKMIKSKQEKLAKSIAISAIKYSMLKMQNNKPIIFNWEQALSLEGNTGPYLQYALVRANKILQKVKSKPSNLDLLTEPQEFELIKKISLFPEIVENAANNYSPHIVANYTYELSQSFSTFYEKCSVIRADKKIKGARLALVKAFAQTLKNALNLLGVEEVAQM